MNSKDWINSALNELTERLKGDENVITLCTFGSINESTVMLDRWSDLDILLVVKESAISNFYPSLEWLAPLGKYFAVEQSISKNSYTSKVIFEDFRKIDLLIVSESNINPELLLNKNLNTVFSKSNRVSEIINTPTSFATNNSGIADLYEINALSNEFWYLSYSVLVKIARNDLLIALHLTLDLYKKCILISLWLRDKKSNTNIHRLGGPRNNDLEKLYFPPSSISRASILVMLENITRIFEELAIEWSKDYTPKYKTFHNLLLESKESLLQ